MKEEILPYECIIDIFLPKSTVIDVILMLWLNYEVVQVQVE